MAVPLAAPLAPVIGKGIKIGLGAAWRYGPILLDMADQFKRSPGLAPRTGRAGSQQRLGELLRDAVAGARVAVASPPPPPLPFNNGPDSWKVPPEIERALRPLLDALQRLGQLWGALSTPASPEAPITWLEADGERVDIKQLSGVVIFYKSTLVTDMSYCFPSDSNPSGSLSYTNKLTVPANAVAFTIVGGGTVTATTSCGVGGIITRPALSVDIEFEDGSTTSTTLRSETWNPLQENQQGTAVGVVGVTDVTSSQGPVPPPGFEPGAGGSAVGNPDGWFSGIAGPIATTPEPFPLAGGGSAQGQIEGSGSALGAGDLAGGSLPAPGAVEVPSNPPPNWFGQTGTTPGTLPTPIPSLPPTPAYVPRPLPGPSPSGDPAPAPETEPQPEKVPGTTPAPPITSPSVPQPGPVAPPLDLPGTVPTPAPTPPPTTDPGTHVPVPGGPPVTGNGPAPTLTEMAKEMGRQEQKLSQLLQRSSQPDGSPVDLGEILGLLLQLLELLSAIDGGGGYQINSPCNIDQETGELLDPLVTEWGASVGILPGLSKRLDAIADLLQYQKDLPQPICSRKKPTGDFVTVNFEQITDDLETP